MNGMKKTVALGMSLILSATLIACGDQKQEPEQNGTTPGASAAVTETADTADQTEETQSPKETEKPSTAQKSDLLPGTYKVPMKNIYLDVPAYQEIEQAYTELFIVHESKYVAFTAGYDSVATDAKDAHDKAFDDDFVWNMQNYEGGVNSINITKDEIIDVNGMEVYSFEGTINYGRANIHDGYAKGYSFIMDGIPCEIIGSVIDDSQSQELIDEISEVVDAMIQSVRATK